MKSSNTIIKPVNWNTVNIFDDSDDSGVYKNILYMLGVDDDSDDSGVDKNTLYMLGVDAVRALAEGNSSELEKYCLQIATGLIKGEILSLSDSISDSEDIAYIKMMGNKIAQYTAMIDNISIKAKTCLKM